MWNREGSYGRIRHWQGRGSCYPVWSLVLYTGGKGLVSKETDDASFIWGLYFLSSPSSYFIYRSSTATISPCLSLKIVVSVEPWYPHKGSLTIMVWPL